MTGGPEVPGQGDLLDLLAAEAAAHLAAATGRPSHLTVTHLVLPNMAIACGRDLLEDTRAAAAAQHVEPVDEAPAGGSEETRRRPRLLAYSPPYVTCPDCLATGDLPALIAGMRSCQAPTT